MFASLSFPKLTGVQFGVGHICMEGQTLHLEPCELRGNVSETAFPLANLCRRKGEAARKVCKELNRQQAVQISGHCFQWDAPVQRI